MNDPVHLDPARFFEFIDTPDLSVVFVSIHPFHPANTALGRRIREAHGDGARFGAIELPELLVRQSPVLPFLQQGLAACGARPLLEVMPGYYAFCDGRMLAWDSGLPTPGDARPILRGSFLGLVAFAVTRDYGYLGKALYLATDEATAVRLAQRFHAAYAARDTTARPPRPPSSADDVSRAYQTLGVRPEASDDEINSAWRKLGLELHPDHAATDEVEFKRRTRLIAEINRARDVIRDHRSRMAS
jgi:hypothetical protein